jgi:hypothetical protein
VFLKRVEVAVGVQEFESRLDAVRCDQAVDGAPDSDPTAAKQPEVLRAANSDVDPRQRMQLKFHKLSPHPHELEFVPDSAQNLMDNEVARVDAPLAKPRPKQLHLVRACAPERVDPDGRVREDAQFARLIAL